LEFHRRKEKEQNERSRLPAGETVWLPAVWTSEVYFAGHLPKLIGGIEALNWTADWDLGTHHDLTVWIQRVRQRGKGAARRGNVWVASNREPLVMRTGSDFSARLPEGVTAMSFELIQPSPTYVVLTCAFLLEKSVSQKLNAVLATDYSAEIEAMGTGWTAVDALQRKTIEADRIRAGIRADCCRFLAEHLPGFFAEKAADYEAFPAADMLLLESTSLEDLEARHRGSFLGVLGLDLPMFDQLGVTHPGLLLCLPSDSWHADRFTTFAATIPELLPGDDLKGYYDGRTPSGFVLRLHGLAELVGLTAVVSVLTDLHAMIADARDQLGVQLNASETEQRQRLDEVQKFAARLVSDFSFTLQEWRSGEGLTYLAEDVPEFRPREPKLWREGSLAKGVAEEIRADAERIAGAIGILQDALQVQSSLVAASASARAAQTNLVLQVLTILLALIAVVVAVVLR
jgi:hypothetical protein